MLVSKFVMKLTRLPIIQGKNKSVATNMAISFGTKLNVAS
jgi:hypothetical protein